ncbi:hypothetical protein An07g09440 [Aspergillus niger]|uniref:Uncharacterized protein n=2 Tax=Aspergillus niger TaxID=5061 RepID=A2QPH3_ASPNC|nr:hypothetical protein An07g09440 [Aspergillus niger]CAK39710.1 hypothetical protein An07g09440 [Aspergillus niger]
MGFQDGPPDRVARSTVDYVTLSPGTMSHDGIVKSEKRTSDDGVTATLAEQEFHAVCEPSSLDALDLGLSESGVVQGINRGIEPRIRHQVQMSFDAGTWISTGAIALSDTYLAGSVSLNALVDCRVTTHYPTQDILMIDAALVQGRAKRGAGHSTKHEEVDDCHGSGHPTNVGEGGGIPDRWVGREEGRKGSDASAERISHGGEHSSIGVVRADGGDKKALSRIISAEGPHAPQAAPRKTDKNRTKESDPDCVNELNQSSISSIRAFV